MRTTVYGAAIAVMLTMVTVLSSATAQVSNNTPLAFGMNADQVSQVLGMTLVYVSVLRATKCSSLCPTSRQRVVGPSDGLYLQFRRGRLKGWKGDWGTNRPCCN